MLVWYRNSILASIISLIGCAGVVAGISELLKDASQREMSVPETLGFIAAGILFAVLGKVISSNKEKKKQAAAGAAGYAQPAASARTAPVRSAQQAAAPVQTRPIGKAAGLASTCWLLATVCSLWGFYLYRQWTRKYGSEISGSVGMDRLAVLLLLAGIICAVLMTASSRTKKLQKASGLYVPGFLGMIALCAEDAVRCYRAYGFGGFIANDGSTYYALISVPLLRMAAFLLMILFAVIAMKDTRIRNGGVVRALWFVPFVMLALAFAKALTDSYLYDLIVSTLFRKGVRLTLRPEYLDMLSQLFAILAVLFTGFCFRTACCRDRNAGLQAADPEPAAPQVSYCEAPAAAYAAPVMQTPVQPQVTRYAAEPVQPAPAADVAPSSRLGQQDVEKKLQACKDLLDCGILSQEEYQQQVYELTHQ